MSVGYAKLELMKGNKMNKSEIALMGSRDLVEFVKGKTDLTDIGAYAYGLTLVWSFADDKLKNKIVKMIEENH